MSIDQTVENVYLRQDAVRLTRKHFWRLLGMMVLMSLISGVLDWALTAIGDLITKPETQAVMSAMQEYSADPSIASGNLYLDKVAQLFTSPRFLLFNLAYMILTSLMAEGLRLGYNAQLIAAGQDQTPRVLGVFGRMRFCLKGLGLTLFTGLKVLLWMLPGLLSIMIGTELEGYGQFGIGGMMNVVGLGLLFGLMIPALLRYAMAPFILANEPDRGIRECVTLSKGMMQYRKWQCFKLGVPMVLKMLGTFYGMALVFSLVMMVAAILELESVILSTVLLAGMLLLLIAPMLYFGMQMEIAYVLFYLKRYMPAADGPVSYWLRKDFPDDGPTSYLLRKDSPAEISPFTDAPAESTTDSPEDSSHKTNEEEGETK